MNIEEMEKWIDSMEYDLEQIKNAELWIQHIKDCRGEDIKFLKGELKKEKTNK